MAATGIRAQKKTLRPGEIIEATFLQFCETGYDRTRIEDIAARLGVTKGTIYFYFPTKEDVFMAMVRSISLSLSEGLAEPTDSSASAVMQLKSFLRRVFDRLIKEPKGREVLRFLLAEGHKFPGLLTRHQCEFREPVLERCREIVLYGVKVGEFRPEIADMDVELFVAPILSMSISLLLHGDRADHLLDSYFDHYIDLLLNGMSFQGAVR